MDIINISKKDKQLFGEVSLPTSKSISNRLLILQFLSGSSIRIRDLSRADDTVLLSTSLDMIRNHMISGNEQITRIDTRNAGTVMRFLTALLSMTRGTWLLTGDKRMLNRPVGILVDALRELGADIQHMERVNYLPLLIKGRNLYSRDITVDASVSSQFISALLLIAPFLPDGITMNLKGAPSSSPFIRLTLRIMEEAGLSTVWQENLIRVYNKQVPEKDLSVEADWSSAAFWYGMMAVAKEGDLLLKGLKMSGMQGDEYIEEISHAFGVIGIQEEGGVRIRKAGPVATHLDFDFRDFPDLAQPVIVTAALKGINGVFTGLENLRLKETDRLEALRTELQKIGASLNEVAKGYWNLTPRNVSKKEISIDIYEDHRMAMSFAIPAFAGYKVKIMQPGVVDKSYPGFWDQMKSVGVTI